MFLKHLRLFNFKNYLECDVHFQDTINVIVGPNGGGKTTLLDAIHYLSMTKSAFSTPDTGNIHKNTEFFSIHGRFENPAEKLDVSCNLKRGQKKIVNIKNKAYEKLSDHIGRLPVVMIAPDDVDLIREGSEIRRRFIDVIISQIHKPYLQALIKYNGYLKQRNALLKKYGHTLHTKSDIFEPYDIQLLALSKEISGFRESFMIDYSSLFQSHYALVADKKENASINYSSQAILTNYDDLFLQNRQRDIDTQRTNMGIHKDDYDFSIDGMLVKKFASQGQKKSFTVALQLAKYQILKTCLNKNPLMLLDDIFDKLDDKRIDALLKLVSSGKFGQLFITDAREERTKEVLAKLNQEIKYIYVNNGSVKG